LGRGMEIFIRREEDVEKDYSILNDIVYEED
jgi:hypothetical protein